MEKLNINPLILQKFTVNPRPTLWEISQEDKQKSLEADRCPWCNNKLKFLGTRPIAICNSVKHGGKAFIKKL